MLTTACLCVQSLRHVGKDTTVLLICVTVFLSYLPEAGQYSSFFLYLRQVTHTHTPPAAAASGPQKTNLFLVSCCSHVGIRLSNKM